MAARKHSTEDLPSCVSSEQVANAEVQTQRSTAADVLKIRDFRFLFVSLGVLIFAFEMRTMAQSWLALELTDSQAWVGIVNGVPAIAVIALSLLGGVVADRYPKRTILLWVRAGLAALAFLVGFLVITDAIAIWHLILLALVQGSIIAFGMPAGQTFIIEIVGRERLLTANMLSQTVASVGTMAGPALGGVLLGLFGVSAVYIIVGAIYVFSIMVLVPVRTRTISNPESTATPIRDIKEGLAFVRSDVRIRNLMILNILALFAGFMMPLIPLYARDILKVGETGFGFLMGAFGVGAIIGAGSLSLMGNVQKKALILVIAPVIWGIGMVMFGYSRSFPMSLVILGVMGGIGPVYVAVIMTLAQTLAPERMRARVISIFSITMQLFPLGWMAGGILAVLIGNEETLIIGAIGMLVFPVYLYVTSADFRNVT